MNTNAISKKRFVDALSNVGTEIEMIPGGYTSVIQVMDVEINKQLKDNITNSYINWASEKYSHLSNGDKFPKPSREDITKWVMMSWEKIITKESILKTFNHVGLNMNDRLS